MSSDHTLRSIPEEDAPAVPDGWLDLTDIALGFDVLSQQGEDIVAIVVHFPEGTDPIGFTFDAVGALALGAGIIEAASNAAGLEDDEG